MTTLTLTALQRKANRSDVKLQSGLNVPSTATTGRLDLQTSSLQDV
jgi:hypothetical protein